MKVGNLVKFFDYDYSAAHGGSKQRWSIGIVVDLWTPTEEEKLEHNLINCNTLAVIAHDGKTQWITIPSRRELEGLWVKVLS
jgi:hypothetical protein